MAWLVVLASVGVARADSPPSTALVVLGADDARVAIERAVSESFTPAPQVVDDSKLPASGVLDDAAAVALRQKLDVARLLVVVVRQQGRRFIVSARTVDAGGVTRRFGEAGESDLPFVAARVVGELPAPPKPNPAAPPTKVVEVSSKPVEADPKPAPAAAPVDLVPDEKPAPAAAPVHDVLYRRRHPYGLLVGGVVAFFAPYFATVGVAASNQSYNPNASRLGYIPLVGPFLGRSAINDKDLHDGYDAGLLSDGIVQVLALNVLIAGIIYCAVGEKVRHERASLPSLRPLFTAAPGAAQLGAQVSW